MSEKSSNFGSKIERNTNYARDQFIYGIAIYMYMSEHNSPHFHVEYQGYEAIITIKDGVITGSLPRRALRLVYEWLDQHEEELLANWERLGKSEEPIKIDPLQ